MKRSKFNRIIALLLIAALMVSMVLSLTPVVFAAGDPEVIYINTAEDFAELAERCTLDTWSQGKKVVLQADISLSDAALATIPTFSGTFDGGGHTISGLAITQSMTPSGLFGVLQENAVVKDLRVSADLSPSGHSSSAGGIVGENYGTITGCTFTGSVSGDSNVGGIAGINAVTGQISACKVSGSIIGNKMTGGIAGCNLGVIETCKNSAYVNTVSVDPSLSPEDIKFDFSMDVSKLSSMDAGTSSSDTGGIAGYSSGIVSDCANHAPIGYPHIGYNVGGIVGRSCGYIHACENSADIFGRKDVGGIAGQMEPYIAQSVTESTLFKLEGQLDALDGMLNAALDDANAGVASVTTRLNKIADYMDSAAGAASNIRTSGGVISAVTGNGQTDSGGSVTVTPPQMEADGSFETVGGAGGGIISGGEIAAGGGTASGGEITETGGSIGTGGIAGVGENAGIGGIAGGGIASGGGLQAGLSEGGVEGEHHTSAGGNLSAATQIAITTNLSGLSSAVSGMAGQMRLLSDEISGTSGTLTDDMKAIQQQIHAISDTAMELFQGDGEEDTLIDSSELDIDLVTLGKASDCKNTGSISGDINVGGIAGAMAMEYELDPEDDIASNLNGTQRKKLEIKAIIQDCVNTGKVTSKRSYAGGICGRMDLGLIAQSEGYGDVRSESGDYVGGIAGLTAASVRRCFAKCTLSGETYVGGIAGSGVSEDLSGSSSTVAGCYSMVSIESYQEFAGAISGDYTGNYEENYFVSDTLTGINGRSYTGKAEPVSYAALLEIAASGGGSEPALDGTQTAQNTEPAENTGALEDAGDEETAQAAEPVADAATDEAEITETVFIPDEFLQLTLTFVVDDTVIKTVPFDYGASFDETVYPEIPAKEGFYSCWDKAELSELHFDTVVTAVYTPYVTALSNSENRADGRPIFFVEGQFDDEAAPDVTALPNTPDDFSFLAAGWTDFLAKSFSGRTVSREIVEQWKISIPDDGQRIHTVRYLPPDADPEHLDIHVKGENGWQKADTEIIGSYLVFAVEGQEAEIAAISTSDVWWVWLLAGALLLTLLVVLVCLIRKIVKKKKRAPAAVRAGRAWDEEIQPEAVQNEDWFVPSDAAPKRKKRWLTPLLVVLALLVGIGGTAAFFLLPDLLDDAKAYDLLKEYSEKQELTMELTVDGALDSQDFDFIATLDRTDVDGHRVTAISQDGRTLYYCDGTVFLENGNAYKLSSDFPDYSQLLEQTMQLYRYVDIDETDGTYAITAQSADAKAILDLLMPSAAGLFADTNTLEVALLTDGDEISEIHFSANGTLADKEKTPFALSAVCTLQPEGQSRIPIPEAVRNVVTSGAYEASEVLSDDLLRMANAWQALSRADSVSAKLLLNADCGPVTLDESFDFYRWNDKGTQISSIQKNGYALYFTDTTVCNQNGSVIPAADASAVEAASLLDIAFQTCLNAKLDCGESGSLYTYTLSLDESGMEAVAYAIAPATKDMDIFFDSGSMQVVICKDQIQSIVICCGGTVQVVLSHAEVTFEARMEFADDTETASIPEAVKETLEK